MKTVERDEWGAACLMASAPKNFTTSRVGCASERKLFFFQRKEGVGLGKGARACGKSGHFATREKKRYIDFGAWVGYYVG